MVRGWPFVLAFALMMALAIADVGRAVGAVGSCTAQQLSATASFQGETGSEVGGVSLRNRGPHACLLPRRARLAIYWKQQRLRVAETPYAAYQPNNGQRQVGQLESRQRAFVPIWWSNWCGARPWGKGFFRPYLRLTLADSTTLTVTLRHPSEIPPPRCDSPNQRTTFEVGRFYTPLPLGWIP